MVSRAQCLFERVFRGREIVNLRLVNGVCGGCGSEGDLGWISFRKKQSYRVIVRAITGLGITIR